VAAEAAAFRAQHSSSAQIRTKFSTATEHWLPKAWQGKQIDIVPGELVQDGRFYDVAIDLKVAGVAGQNEVQRARERMRDFRSGLGGKFGMRSRRRR